MFHKIINKIMNKEECQFDKNYEEVSYTLNCGC